MSDRGAERSRRYRLLAEPADDSRGRRFARRIAGAPGPRFADIANVPDWLTATPEQQDRLARLTILLRHRHAIDTELSGPRLALLAEAVGEELLDMACDAAAPAGGSPTSLPQPERLLDDGRAILQAGLPRPLADRYPGARDDPEARALTAHAARIIG